LSSANTPELLSTKSGDEPKLLTGSTLNLSLRQALPLMGNILPLAVVDFAMEAIKSQQKRI
jgi:hypothetical protein